MPKISSPWQIHAVQDTPIRNEAGRAPEHADLLLLTNGVQTDGAVGIPALDLGCCPKRLVGTFRLGHQTGQTRTSGNCRSERPSIRDRDLWLPRLKGQMREFFKLSTSVNSVFLQIVDFYHLSRSDQPLVMDYIHRLCKTKIEAYAFRGAICESV